MRTRSFVAAAAALALVTAVNADAQRPTFSSRSHGPTLGVSFAGVGLNTRALGSLEKKEFTGGGVQMELGWQMIDSHFGLIVDYANINIDTDGPPNIRGYNHIGGLGRYIFRSDRDIVRPYVELGIQRREVTGRTSGPLPRSVRTQSIGGALGGGMQVFLARPVALDIGLQVGLGGFGDWKGGDLVAPSMPELEQSSAVLRVGIRFWPGY